MIQKELKAVEAFHKAFKIDCENATYRCHFRKH